MMVKLERVDGSQNFTFCHVYDTFEAVNGVIEVPDELVTIATGTGLYQLVQEKPAPVAKPKAKPVKVEGEAE